MEPVAQLLAASGILCLCIAAWGLACLFLETYSTGDFAYRSTAKGWLGLSFFFLGCAGIALLFALT